MDSDELSFRVRELKNLIEDEDRKRLTNKVKLSLKFLNSKYEHDFERVWDLGFQHESKSSNY